MKEGAFMPRIIRISLLLEKPSAKVDTGFAKARPDPERAWLP
jgi:hypothetical protein